MKIFKIFAFVLITVFLFSFSKKNDSNKKWYKGNTHAHTTVSDGNASTEYVTNWYHEHGYNFLFITDHNKRVNPDTVKMPTNKRGDFILIPGEEVTGERLIHTTGLNVSEYVDPGPELNSKTEVIQNHVKSIRKANGVTIINHPNFRSGAQVSDIIKVKNLNMIEVYNGHPGTYSFGYIGKPVSHISVEEKWDSLLTMGMKIYGVAADDAHHYDEFYAEKVNPGRGWVMVQSDNLDANSIVSAMENGDFYASIGVILKSIKTNKKSYSVEIDLEATKIELRSAYLLGNFVDEEKPGYRIEFIGLNGEILQATDGLSASYKITDEKGYIRARAIYCRKRSENKYEKLFAWTQPIFIN